MKTNKNIARIGALLVAVGFLIFAVSFVGMLSASKFVRLTDLDRLNRAESAEKAVETALSMISTRINDVVSYYDTQAADEAKVEKHDEYVQRAATFRALEEELTSTKGLSEKAYKALRHIVSVDGVEKEVTPLNNLQNQLSIIYDNQQSAIEYRAKITTDMTVLKEQQAASASQDEAVVSKLSFYAGMIFGAVLFAIGLYFNHGYQIKRVISQVSLYILLIIGATIMVFPFYWMISSSFKTRVEISRFPPEFVPGNLLNIDNYRIAFKQAPFARYFMNSVIVCICSVSVVTFTTILASFAFSRLKFPGRELIFSALLSMMMLPFEMLVITNYSTIIHLNLNDTLAALVFPFISSIFYTYIMRNFFASIPDSLYWSARVDGCSNWRYLWKIMVPIARPSLVTVVLLNALASWNSFMWPLLVIKSTDKRTLPFGLYAFTTEAGSFQELIMAASTVVVLPMIILFLFARKQILRGVARGGIKG